MIRLEQISFGYPHQRQLFDALSLTLKPGHIYGLLGKNGAGKSSLLRNIAGLLVAFGCITYVRLKEKEI